MTSSYASHYASISPQLGGAAIRKQLRDVLSAFDRGARARVIMAVFTEQYYHTFVLDRTGRAHELKSKASAGGGTFKFVLEPAHNGLLKFTAYFPNTRQVYKTGTLVRVYPLDK